MNRKFVKPTALVVAAMFSAIATITYFEHKAMGQASGEVGAIEGIVDDPQLDTLAAVVYIREVPGEAKPLTNKTSMSQKKITFNPHIVAVCVGTTLECPNDDNVTHNIFSPTKSAKPFNFGLYPPGSKKVLELTKVGVVPFLCNIHSEMGGFCVVCPNPFFTKTEKGGKFKIENVPAGTYQLMFWHEKLKPKTIEVKVAAGATQEVKFSALDKAKYSIDLLK